MSARIPQGKVDYKSHRRSHEVVLRVELIERRLKDLHVNRPSRVLEVGVGSGATTKMLIEHFDRVTCVDLEQERIEEVAAYVAEPKPEFVCAAAEAVALPEGAFDHVFLIGLLEHLPDPPAVLRNVRPALSDKGRMHVLVNNAGSIHRHLGVALGQIRDVEDRSQSDIMLGHYRVYTPDKLQAEIERCGFKIDYIDLHYLKPLPTKRMDELPLWMSEAFVKLGRKFPEFSAYTYLEAVLA
jgi:SAM-dependent methyltransferase